MFPQARNYWSYNSCWSSKYVAGVPLSTQPNRRRSRRRTDSTAAASSYLIWLRGIDLRGYYVAKHKERERTKTTEGEKERRKPKSPVSVFWKHFLLHCICVISTFDSRCCYSCFGEPSFLPKLLQSTCCVRSFFLSLYHGYAVIALELFFARSIIPSPSVFVTVYSIIKWLSGETSHSVVLSNIRSLSIHCANAFLGLCFFPQSLSIIPGHGSLA